MPNKRTKVDSRVLTKLREQIKREQPAERRDTIRVDPELDEAIDAYVAEVNKIDPEIKMDRGKFFRTAAREYLGLLPKAVAATRKNGLIYEPIETLQIA